MTAHGRREREIETERKRETLLDQEERGFLSVQEFLSTARKIKSSLFFIIFISPNDSHKTLNYMK